MSGDEEYAIVARELSKTFRIFTERNQTLKQALLRRRRAVYEEFAAVDDVSFAVKRGSTFGIIGSNGSGKSTTLKVLAKILEPDRGSVEVTGRVSALLELGAGFHPELSGRENVYLNAAILGIPKKQVEKSFDAIVDFAELGRFIENPVKTYSSGMYARLGFAVAVNVDPDVLLIDEVLAVGDESFQRRCAEKIDDLRSNGRTVVIVSHGLSSIQSLCDAAIWIEKGKLRAAGDPGFVIDEYVKAVHPDSVANEAGGVHIGSGEIRITRVQVDSESPIRTGDPVRVQIGWRAESPYGPAIISLFVRRTDGVRIGSLTTAEADPAGFKIAMGDGSLSWQIESLPVLPGTYEIDVEVTDPTRSHIVDRLTHATRFDVSTDRLGSELDGVIALRASWTHA
jgi:ABC-2 type transport system ATP-binding protein